MKAVVFTKDNELKLVNNYQKPIPKKGEALVINNNIEVTVLEVKGDQVKIGISAPKEVPIYRKEVYLQIQDSNKEAMQADLEALKKLF